MWRNDEGAGLLLEYCNNVHRLNAGVVPHHCLGRYCAGPGACSFRHGDAVLRAALGQDGEEEALALEGTLVTLLLE